jgi:hypothetical protein
VTVHRFEVFQRLTNPWGTPKTTEVVEDLAFCGSDCGSGFSAFLRFLVGERVARWQQLSQGPLVRKGDLNEAAGAADTASMRGYEQQWLR